MARLTRWRLRGDLGEILYAAICPRCGLPRGWRREDKAGGHARELAEEGRTGNLHAWAFVPGDDGTCDEHPEE